MRVWQTSFWETKTQEVKSFAQGHTAWASTLKTPYSPTYKPLHILNKLVLETGKLRDFFVVNALFSKSGSSVVRPVGSVFTEDSRMTLTSCCEPGSPPQTARDLPGLPATPRAFRVAGTSPPPCWPLHAICWSSHRPPDNAWLPTRATLP